MALARRVAQRQDRLIYGVFDYFMRIAAWYILSKGFTYSRTEVFFLTGIYGIFTEEVGQVFM